MKKLILLGSLLVTQLTFSQTKFSKGDQFASVSYGLGTQAFIGSRYFFTDNIAAFGEPCLFKYWSNLQVLNK